MASEAERYKARLLDETAEDVVELSNFYYQSTGEQRYADRFEAAFYEAVEGLTYMPRIFPKWQDRDDVRRYNMATHNVSIIYLIDDDELEIVAVKAFHAMQEPDKVTWLVDKRIANHHRQQN
jgi:plasmid stabilization system protein ParE